LGGALLFWCVLAPLLWGTAARAQETESADMEQAAPAPLLESSATGFLDVRPAWQHVHEGGIATTDDIPAWLLVTEANFQLRLRWGGRGMAYADASFVGQNGWTFLHTGDDGKLSEAADHDVAALRPAAVLSELYGLVHLGPHANLTLGRKRVVWGPGLAQNPTDLVDPPKDPTDPTCQRAGAWLARLEFPFERFTVSLVAAAKVLRQYSGVPTALGVYPDHATTEAASGAVPDDRDGSSHYATAVRLYALVVDTDVNAVWYFSNLYNDAFEDKHRFGLSLSRVFGAWEVHVEALAQRGSSRRYADSGCVADAAALMQCGLDPARRDRVLSASKRDDPGVRGRVLAGGRWTGADNEMVSIEYYWNGEGWDASELGDLLRLATTARQARSFLPPGATPPSIPSPFGSATADPGTPQKFVFEPLRRHYLFVTAMVPNVRNDFTLQAVLLAGLEDLSGQVVPSVAWSVREWATLTAAVAVPLPGVSSLGVEAGGRRWTESDVMPADWRAWVSARLFY